MTTSPRTADPAGAATRSPPGGGRSRLRRRLLGALAVATLAVAGWLGASAWVMHDLTRPSQRTANAPPVLPGARYETPELATSDGERLAALYLDASPGRPAVLLLHGSDESRERWFALLPRLAARDVAALVPDLRAHGESSGRLNDFGWSARSDVAAWVEWLAERRPGGRPVVAGFSMGAAAALFAAPQLEGRVGGYLLESCYLDLDGSNDRRLRARLPAPLDRVAGLGLRVVEPLFLGFDPGVDSPIRWADRMPAGTPVLVLGAEGDDRAPLEDQRLLARRLGPAARLVSYPGGSHAPLAVRDPERFAALLDELLEGAGARATEPGR